MPSRHQEIIAGGLLELESQISVASMPGFSSGGSIVIFTVSGATAEYGNGYRHVGLVVAHYGTELVKSSSALGMRPKRLNKSSKYMCLRNISETFQ